MLAAELDHALQVFVRCCCARGVVGVVDPQYPRTFGVYRVRVQQEAVLALQFHGQSFAAGEQVRLTLRNEDRGMSHDFSVKSWGVATKVLDGKGQDTVTFRVPRGSNASTSYTCTPHTAMMNGAIVIE